MNMRVRANQCSLEGNDGPELDNQMSHPALTWPNMSDTSPSLGGSLQASTLSVDRYFASTSRKKIVDCEEGARTKGTKNV